MSREAASAVQKAVERGELTDCGMAYVLERIADQADEEHSCHPEIEYLARSTAQGYSTARKHVTRLVDGGWMTRERMANGDGTLGGYRFFLCAEKLNLQPVHRSNRAVDETQQNSTARSEQTPAPSTAQIEHTTARIERSSKKDSFLPSYFLSEDEEERKFVEAVLRVAGPRLGDWRVERGRRIIDSLTLRRETWLASFDLEKDVLPTVKAKTAKKRGAPLMDLSVIEPDIWKHREARLRPIAGTRGLTQTDAQELATLNRQLRAMRATGDSYATRNLTGTAKASAVAQEIREVEARIARLQAKEFATTGAGA